MARVRLSGRDGPPRYEPLRRRAQPSATRYPRSGGSVRRGLTGSSRIAANVSPLVRSAAATRVRPRRQTISPEQHDPPLARALAPAPDEGYVIRHDRQQRAVEDSVYERTHDGNCEQ